MRISELARQRLLRLQSQSPTKPKLPEYASVEFARKNLGVVPWSKQVEILNAVEQHPRVAVRSGHKVSKSNSAAILALWWYSTRERARAILTSSSGRQVKEILWREIRFLYEHAKVPIDGSMHLLPASGLTSSDGRQIVGVATEKPENMAGFSGENILYIVDEASGVPEEIFEAIEGNRAGGAKIVMFSNPTRTSGYFYDAFNSKREFWHTIKISSEDSPNITGETQIPGLAVKGWVEEMIREHGDPSPFVDVRIRGNFPSQAENCVISLSDVEMARTRWEEPTVDDGPLELGVDVARFGDDETVIQYRRGKRAAMPVAIRSMDTVDVSGRVLQLARLLRKDGERPKVKIDVIGVGAGVVDTLMRETDVEVVAVNVSESATDESYHRLRDQLWFACRDWLRDGGGLPPDSKLEAELVAPTYGFEARSRIKVESKDDIKRKIKRSPDRADALALAVYNPPARARASLSSSDFLEY